MSVAVLSEHPFLYVSSMKLTYEGIAILTVREHPVGKGQEVSPATYASILSQTA